MTSTPEQRAALRTELRARRKAFVESLSPAERNLSFRVLPSPILQMIAPGARIALYAPVGSEAPTEALAWFLHDRGWPLCLPRLLPGDAALMDFGAWTPEEALVPGPKRIPQPSPTAEAVTPDIGFTPLVGFDSQLNRLGQGGGNYDRIFARLPDAMRIGLAWSAQMVDSLDVEPWDMPLHMVITEKSFFTPV